MSFCSPKQQISKTLKNSCFDESTVNEMVEHFNDTHPDKKIASKKSIEERYKELNQRLKNEKTCDGEWCLASTPTMSPLKQKIKSNFRPKVPKAWKSNKHTWLNTDDIMNVLNQYNDAYNNFRFLTVTPIDFDTRLRDNMCVDRSLCELDLGKELARNTCKLGAVFNLDRHDQSGSHWTAFFADIPSGESYYIDSVANFIPEEITSLMERITKQGNDLVESGKIKITSTKHRFSFKTEQTSKSHSIPLRSLLNHLVKHDQFLNYRFGSLYKAIVMDCKINHSDVITKESSKCILDLIERTNKDVYIRIPNIEKFIEDIDAGELTLEDFSKKLIETHISIALKHFIDLFNILYDGETTYRIVHKEIDDDILNIQLNKEAKKDKNLLDVSFKMFKNYIQHQYQNTECGMYSINFIDQFLTGGGDFNKITGDITDDESINELRYSKYYRPRQ